MSGTDTTRTRPRTGDELELTIDRLAHGGAGVARLDGYVVFVRGAVPGDRVRARVTKAKRSFAEADSVELLEPIEAAVEPLRYRNKLEYSFGEDDSGELVLGFHRPGRFDAIDDVSLDILASERVDELREAVKAWCRAEGLTAWDRRSQLGVLRNLVVREGRRTGQLQARVVTSPGSTFRVDELAAAAS